MSLAAVMALGATSALLPPGKLLYLTAARGSAGENIVLSSFDFIANKTQAIATLGGIPPLARHDSLYTFFSTDWTPCFSQLWLNFYLLFHDRARSGRKRRP